LVQQYHDLGIDTWVLGLGDLRTTLIDVANAGGHPLFTIDVGDPPTTTEQLLSHLSAIPQPVFSCTPAMPTTLPDGRTIEPSKVSYTSSDQSTPQSVSNNPGCSSGDGSGWTYSGNGFELCAATCNQLKRAPGAQLTVEFACDATLPCASCL
jgi:hypothetical protein